MSIWTFYGARYDGQRNEGDRVVPRSQTRTKRTQSTAESARYARCRKQISPQLPTMQETRPCTRSSARCRAEAGTRKKKRVAKRTAAVGKRINEQTNHAIYKLVVGQR